MWPLEWSRRAINLNIIERADQSSLCGQSKAMETRVEVERAAGGQKFEDWKFDKKVCGFVWWMIDVTNVVSTTSSGAKELVSFNLKLSSIFSTWIALSTQFIVLIHFRNCTTRDSACSYESMNPDIDLIETMMRITSSVPAQKQKQN